MATPIAFCIGATTSSVNVSDAHAARILAAEQKYMGAANSQETVDALLRRFFAELKGDTKSIERAALAVEDIKEV